MGHLCVLAIDIGTQSTRAAFVNERARIIEVATSRITLGTPQPGYAEQDPDVWWESTVANITAIRRARPDVAVAAIGVGAQMHSAVPLDKHGDPLDRAVGIWSDKRAVPLVEEFRRRPESKHLAAVAGNVPLPAWPGFKIAWYKLAQPEVYASAHTFLVAKDYLNLRLCGVAATDPSEASGTFLCAADSGQWSEELIGALDLDSRLLPPIVASTSVIGGLLPEVAARTGLPTGIPVAAGGGDMLCQLLACGLTSPGRLAEVAGTASIVAAHSERPVLDERVMSLRTVTGEWVNFGIGDGAGSCLTWLAKHTVSGEGGQLDLRALDAAAADVPPGADGLLFLPYPLGERTLGDPRSRSSFIGLTLEHHRGHLARAVMEGICFENRRAIDLIAGDGEASICCSGGGAQSALWNQIRADVYGRRVQQLGTEEGGIRGAALLAGAAAGWYSDVGAAA